MVRKQSMYDTRSYRSLLVVSGHLLFPFSALFSFTLSLSCNYYNLHGLYLPLECYISFLFHSLMSALQLVYLEFVLLTPCFIVLVL